MSLMGMLQRYMNPASVVPTETEAHFDQVARTAPPDLVGQGIAGALRSDQTPPFNEMVAQLFGNSNPQQRAGLLNELLRSVGPGLLSGLAGGALGRILQNVQGGAAGASVPHPAAVAWVIKLPTIVSLIEASSRFGLSAELVLVILKW